MQAHVASVSIKISISVSIDKRELPTDVFPTPDYLVWGML